MMSNITNYLSSAALCIVPDYGVKLPSASNAFDTLFPVSKKSLKDTICTTAELATNIFTDVLPHFILKAPWYFFRESNPRILALFFVFFRIDATLTHVRSSLSSSSNVHLPRKHKNSIFKIPNLAVSSYSLESVKKALSLFVVKMKNEPVFSSNYKQLLITFLTLFKQTMTNLAHLTNKNGIVLALKNILTIVAFLDLNLFISLPQTVFGLQTQEYPFKLILDTLLLTLAFIECLSTATAGIDRILQSIKYKHLSLKDRVRCFASGATLSFLGVTSFYSTLLTIRKLSEGLAIFHQLDPQQQEGVLKNNALSSLANDKTCNAVIIDGTSSIWGRKGDDKSFSFLTKIYQHCHVRYYRAESSLTFCQNLKDASEKLNSLHTLIFFGHANPYELILNNNYILSTSSQEEWKCINQYTTSNSQIFFLGCNTAFASGSFSITQYVSTVLLGKKITGIASYLNPFFTTDSYTNGNVQLDENLVPLRMEYEASHWLKRWLVDRVFQDAIISSPFGAIKTYINGSLVSK